MAGRQERGWRRKGMDRMDVEAGEGEWGGREGWICRGRGGEEGMLVVVVDSVKEGCPTASPPTYPHPPTPLSFSGRPTKYAD